MTAATTIIGLLPLAIGGVNVSGLLYYPMARTVMGGLMSSVVLTLLVLPYITLGTEGVANWLRADLEGLSEHETETRGGCCSVGSEIPILSVGEIYLSFRNEDASFLIL